LSSFTSYQYIFDIVLIDSVDRVKGGKSVAKVIELITKSEQKRWLVLSKEDNPVVPIAKYLKYKDGLGKAPRTLKSYAYHLKAYWNYIEQKELGLGDVDLNVLADYMHWLRHGKQEWNVTPINQSCTEKTVVRSERTINIMLVCLVDFYDFLLRNGEVDFDLRSKVMKVVKKKGRRFKGFLDHVAPNTTVKNVLKLKEPKRKIKVLTHEQIQRVYKACCNQRDELLIAIMYEGGLRASEALSLWIEDFNINEKSIVVRESKTKAGENRKVFVSSETMNLFQDYILDYHSEDVDSNFVFINLRGKRKGEPLQYWALQSLIKRIRQKTGVQLNAHMFRHSYATQLHELGVEVAIIQKLLGHSYVQTTIDMYIHPSDKSIKKQWDKVQNKKETDI
jgi:integrase/recombinase XerD